MKFKTIYSLAIKDDYLYAGTYRGGVWKRKLSEIVSGIENNKDVNEITVWPNPASDRLFIKMPNAVSTEVNNIDLNGHVHKKNFYNSNQIDVSLGDMPSGIYLVKIISGNNVFIEKFIKQE